MYDYYGYNPYKPMRDIIEASMELDYSSNNFKGFYNDNKQPLFNMGIGLLGTVGNQLDYDRRYKDNLRRKNNGQYIPIPYDRNAYNNSLSDFYNRYQSGGETDKTEETDLWNHVDFGTTNNDDFNSLIDEIFKEEPEPDQFQLQDELLWLGLNQPEPSYSNPISPTVSTKSDNEQFSKEYLLSKGLPRNIVAGILGNLKQESNFNPNAIGDNGASFGVAQWQGNRRKKLESRYGVNPSLQNQLDFLISEEGESDVLNEMYDMTPSQAAYHFAKKYERPNPKYANYEYRMQYANNL